MPNKMQRYTFLAEKCKDGVKKGKKGGGNPNAAHEDWCHKDKLKGMMDDGWWLKIVDYRLDDAHLRHI